MPASANAGAGAAAGDYRRGPGRNKSTRTARGVGQGGMLGSKESPRDERGQEHRSTHMAAMCCAGRALGNPQGLQKGLISRRARKNERFPFAEHDCLGTREPCPVMGKATWSRLPTQKSRQAIVNNTPSSTQHPEPDPCKPQPRSLPAMLRMGPAKPWAWSAVRLHAQVRRRRNHHSEVVVLEQAA